MNPDSGEAVTVHVVPHSHWDREWYLPFEGYRHRLLLLLDRVLDILAADEEWRVFVLDGQSIVLEDYLALRPDRRALLRRRVAEGRLSVGPWYVLPDEFLVSGEALVRNLQEGRRVAAEFGGDAGVGYSPDPFGHVSQLPQLLRGFGIGAALFARGIGAQPTRTLYRWEAPDGSAVYGCHLATSYSNGRLLPTGREEAVARLQAEVARLEPARVGPVLLICAGSDHEMPQPELAAHVAAADASPGSVRFRLATFAEYVQAVEDAISPGDPRLICLRGELRGSRLLPLLPGVLSARMPLKQANDRCQDLLEQVAEPLCAVSRLLGGSDAAASLHYAWRLLLENHPHDSICGCSIDAVHRENAVRFEKVEQVAQTLTDEACDFLSARVAARPHGVGAGAEEMRRYVVVNPLAWERREPVSLEVEEVLDERWREVGPGDVARPAGTWEAVDGEGRPLSLQVLSERVGEGTFPHPSDRLVRTTRLALLAEVPAMGATAIFLRRAPTPPKRSPEEGDAVHAHGRVIEGPTWRVEVAPDGSLAVVERASGRFWKGIATLEDREDAGDSYNFSPLPEGHGLRVVGFSEEPRVRCVASGPLEAALVIEGTMRLPAGLAAHRRSRAEETVLCPVTIRVSMRVGVPWIEVQGSLENLARDHRLRLLLPVHGDGGEAWAEAPFDMVRRPRVEAGGPDWIEDPTVAHAHRGFCFVPASPDGERGGLLLLARGLPEYELVEARPTGERAALALTLLRCQGFLAREDIAERRCQAGPKIPTPDGQCLGPFSFRVGIAPLASLPSPPEGAFFRASQAFATPLRAWEPDRPVPFGQESWPRGGRPVVMDEGGRGTTVVDADDAAPSSASWMAVEGPQAIVSAFFVRAEDGDGVMRLFNPSSSPEVARAWFAPELGWSGEGAVLAGLDEEPLSSAPPLSWRDGRLEVPLPPHAIRTVRLARRGGAGEGAGEVQTAE